MDGIKKMTPKLYKKKPVTIEAMQFLYDTRYEVEAWAHGSYIQEVDRFLSLRIPTLEGITIASEGDFVIRGVKGEFYACKPDIFELTYEEIESEEVISTSVVRRVNITEGIKTQAGRELIIYMNKHYGSAIWSKTLKSVKAIEKELS